MQATFTIPLNKVEMALQDTSMWPLLQRLRPDPIQLGHLGKLTKPQYRIVTSLTFTHIYCVSSSFLRHNHSSRFCIDFRNTLRSKRRPLREFLGVWRSRSCRHVPVARFIAEALSIIKNEGRVLSGYQNICESIVGREYWPNEASEVSVSWKRSWEEKAGTFRNSTVQER